MNEREASRARWLTANPATQQQIDGGSLQRIADATEKLASAMSISWQQLSTDRDYWKSRAKNVEASEERLARSIVALRGHITRLKRKAAR
jgi:hypothetical protein